MKYENIEDVIKLLIKMYDQDTSCDLLSSLNELDLNRNIGIKIVEIRKEINHLKNDIGNINEIILNNSKADNNTEINNAINILLNQKLEERKLVFDLIRLKNQKNNGVISDNEYLKKRDEILVNIINSRSKIYKSKAWIRFTCSNLNISINTEKLYEYGIYFDPNLKSSDYKISLHESRYIYNDVQELINNNNLLHFLTDEQKEIMAINVILPTYLRIDNKLMK